MTERLTDEMLAAYLAVAEDQTDYAVQFRRPDLVLILTELRQRRAAEQQAGLGVEAAWAAYDKRRSDYLDEHPEAGTYDLIQDGGCSSFHAGYNAAAQGSARVVEAARRYVNAAALTRRGDAQTSGEYNRRLVAEITAFNALTAALGGQPTPEVAQ